MPKFLIRVERTYTARHYLVYAVEADSQEHANNIIDEALEVDSLDPSDESYDDTEEDSGYDEASTWCRIDPEASETWSPLNAVKFIGLDE